MLILFDQATPLPIRSHLKGHVVRTAFQQGWDKLKNGDLIEASELAGFDLFLTTDKNIKYQQNLAERKIAIIILGQQQWPQVQPFVQLIVDVVNAATPGSFSEVEIPIT